MAEKVLTNAVDEKLDALCAFSKANVLRAGSSGMGFWHPEGWQITLYCNRQPEEEGFFVELDVVRPDEVSWKNLANLQAHFVCPEHYEDGVKVPGDHFAPPITSLIGFYCQRGHDHRLYFERLTRD